MRQLINQTLKACLAVRCQGSIILEQPLEYEHLLAPSLAEVQRKGCTSTMALVIALLSWDINHHKCNQLNVNYQFDDIFETNFGISGIQSSVLGTLKYK